MHNFNLVDWTMPARHLGPEHQMLRAPDSMPSLNRLPEVLEAERVEPNPDDSVQIDTSASFQPTSGGPTAPSNVSAAASAGADLSASSVLPVSVIATSFHSVSAPEESRKSSLLKAILAPGIHTDPTDGDRAIVLRWVLRDIKSNRLKFSSVSPLDLQALTEMRLIEDRNDKPALTDAGIKAII